METMNVRLNRHVQIERGKEMKNEKTIEHEGRISRLGGIIEQLGIRMVGIESRLTSIERGIERIDRKIWAGLIIITGLLTKIAFF